MAHSASITVYPQEEADGLRNLLENDRSIAWVCPTRLTDAAAPEQAGRRLSVATNQNQEDLHYLETVLVTAGYLMDPERKLPFGWNQNDDIFDALEVWAARTTPEDKPFNFGHDCADIIGHITDCYAETLACEKNPR